MLRSFYHQKEGEKILYFSKEGDWISDYKSFLNQKPSKINIQAIEDTEVLSISFTSLNQLDAQIPNWDKVARHFFENRFQESESALEVRLNHTIEERYIKLLKEERTILERVPLYMIAQYIGIKPESLSRLRRRLTAKGIY